jgi:NhaP-type Na+/H+ or K+/H+ antiporter
MNDAVLLPIVVLATLLLQSGGTLDARAVGRGIMGLFILGPALGAVVGWAGITMLETIRTRVGVRRDYESLYALGLGFAAFAAAEAVGGSGFLSAFAAGLTIAALDIELCDCFLEYGEATSEMLLLLTFVAFGTALIWTGAAAAVDGWTLVFAVITLVARTAVLWPLLPRMGVRGGDRKIVALFGPRGLSSLLLVLLPVFAGVAGSERLFNVVSLVVLLSLVVHGAIIGMFLRRTSPRRTPPVLVQPTSDGNADAEDRITLEEVRALQQRGEPVIFVDARAEKSFNADPRQAVGAVRIPPDAPVTNSALEARLARDATLVVYCA